MRGTHCDKCLRSLLFRHGEVHQTWSSRTKYFPADLWYPYVVAHIRGDIGRNGPYANWTLAQRVSRCISGFPLPKRVLARDATCCAYCMPYPRPPDRAIAIGNYPCHGMILPFHYGRRSWVGVQKLSFGYSKEVRWIYLRLPKTVSERSQILPLAAIKFWAVKTSDTVQLSTIRQARTSCRDL